MTKPLLVLTLLVYLVIGILYAIETPAWQVPDEPAHYNYIGQLAETGSLPVLRPGDYDADHLGQLTHERFPPELSIAAVEYEDHQPPLYYLLASPIYIVFDGALTPLRLFSVLLGLGVIISAYAVASDVFPHYPLIALGSAAFVAFLPQHVAMMAGVNNDSLAEFLIGLILWMTVRWVSIGMHPASKGNQEKRWLVGLGIVLGLGLVTKTTIVALAPVVALALVFVWRHHVTTTTGTSGRDLLRQIGLVFGPALLIASFWWLRNLSLYGGLDIYGLANHDAIVVGQPRTAQWIQQQGLSSWLERGLTFTFQSFWGQFGWMAVLMPRWLYRGLALCSVLLVLGIVYRWWDMRSSETEATPTGYPAKYDAHTVQVIILGATVLFAVLAYLYYNLTFVQHQGRYLFPALIPIAAGVALGVDGLLRLVRWPRRLYALGFAAPYCALIALDFYALQRIILPALA
jgi:4-amino-4-deoxy-L-arabinose transferase-like glycosyltransferase